MGNKDRKHTGNQWAEHLLINVINPKGWPSHKDFMSLKIDYTEFLNRCAASDVEKPQNLTRRNASQLKRKLTN